MEICDKGNNKKDGDEERRGGWMQRKLNAIWQRYEVTNGKIFLQSRGNGIRWNVCSAPRKDIRHSNTGFNPALEKVWKGSK
jgi:hypothetical protein